MKVYIVVKDTRYNCEDSNLVKAFSKLSEAKKYLKEISAVYRQDAIEDGWKINCYGDDWFEAYEEGFECQNHYYFYIITQEI